MECKIAILEKLVFIALTAQGITSEQAIPFPLHLPGKLGLADMTLIAYIHYV